MRTDSLLIGNFRQAQIISIIMVILGIVIFILKGKGSKLDNQYNKMGDINEIKF